MTEMVTDVLRCVFDSPTALYASVPITTGRRLLHATQSQNVSGTSGVPNHDELSRQVAASNKNDARNFVSNLRAVHGNRVIDPSYLPDIAGWTQKHYMRLWSEVIRRYCSAVCFADGWEFSNGCTHEFVVASQANIDTRDACGRTITREGGALLIATAASELEALGMDNAALLAAHERLRLDLHKTEWDEGTYDLPEERRWQLDARLIACAIDGRRALLLSVPRILPLGLSSTSLLARRLRSGTSDAVIDRTPISERGVLPAFWRRFSCDVIKRCVRGIVLLDDWSVQVDCLFDFYLATKSNLVAIDEQLRTIAHRDAMAMARRAVDAMERSHRDTTPHRLILNALEALPNVA